MASNALLGFRNAIRDSNSGFTNTVSATATMAGYPASAVVDGNPSTAWGFHATTADLDVTLVNNAQSNFAVGAIALTGIRSANNSGSGGAYLSRFLIRCRLYTGGFFGTKVFDQYRIVTRSDICGAGANAYFIVSPCTSTQDKAWGGDAANTSTGVYARFTVTGDGSSDYFYVSEVMMFQCLQARLDHVRQLGGNDQSEVVRSFSGVPYARLGVKSRTFGGRLIGMDERDVFGGARGAFVTSVPPNNPEIGASLNMVNRVAGIANPVLLIQDGSIGGSAYTSSVPTAGTNFDTDILLQTKSILGHLDGPIQANQSGRLAGGTDSAWEGRFQITEIPA